MQVAFADLLPGRKRRVRPFVALNGQPGYDASLEAKYPYDPAKAKQLLAAAGYPNGFDLAVVDTPLVGLSKVISAIGNPASMSTSVTRTATSGASQRTTGMTPTSVRVVIRWRERSPVRNLRACHVSATR